MSWWLFNVRVHPELSLVSVPGAPRGLRKGSSIQRRLECLDGSFVAAAFEVDFEVEEGVEQRGETKPLTELVLAECNFRGKCSSKSKTLSEPGLSLNSLPELSVQPVSPSSLTDISRIVPYWVWLRFLKGRRRWEWFNMLIVLLISWSHLSEKRLSSSKQPLVSKHFS